MDTTNQLKFDDKGLIPAIAQDYETKEVLMIAYMNEESLQRTLKGKKGLLFFSIPAKIMAQRGNKRAFSAY